MRRAIPAAVLLALTPAAVSAARAGDDGMPSDPKAFVEWVKAGHLPPIAPWPRYQGEVKAPPFGVQPPVDANNPIPAGREAWGTPADGGTLVVQYDSDPRDLNHIVTNDAICSYVADLFQPVLAHQNPVAFTYGKPSAEDPEHVFLAEYRTDIAERWVKEDTLVRADGTRLLGAVSEEKTKDGEFWVLRNLVRLDEEYRWEGRLPKAEGDRVLRGTVVTVFLRPGVRWQDGTPFTARDVVFSVKATLNPNVNSDNLKTYFEMVDACQALSDRTLRWVLNRQYFAADDSTVGGNLTIVPLHAYRALFEKANPGKPFDPSGEEFARFFNTCTELNEKPLGTGPYRVESFESHKSVVLVRNEGYFGPRPHADRVIWKFIADPVATIQALKGGEIDFAAHGPTCEQYEKIMKTPEFQVKWVPSVWYTPSMSFIAYNRTNPALSDARVRAALTLLLDRPGFTKAKHYGCSVLVSGDQFVSGRGYDPEVKPLAFDPAAAEALLDESGWRDRDDDGIRDKDGQKLEFTFLIPTERKVTEELAALWVESLTRAGVTVKIAKLDWASFVKKFEDKKFDVITLSWAMDPESDPHQLWHSKWADPTKPSSNATSFADPRADALIEAIQQCLDPKERALYQHALHRILDADAGYTYLYCRAEVGAYDRRWRGVRLYPKRPGFDLAEWYLPKEVQGK